MKNWIYTEEGIIVTTMPTRAQMACFLTKEWVFPDAWTDLLPHYYLLRYSGEQFKALLHDGIIRHRDKTEYHVVYHRCFPEQVFSAYDVALSFRSPPKSYELHSYVLVHPVTSKSGEFPLLKEI